MKQESLDGVVDPTNPPSHSSFNSVVPTVIQFDTVIEWDTVHHTALERSDSGASLAVKDSSSPPESTPTVDTDGEEDQVFVYQGQYCRRHSSTQQWSPFIPPVIPVKEKERDSLEEGKETTLNNDFILTVLMDGLDFPTCFSSPSPHRVSLAYTEEEKNAMAVDYFTAEVKGEMDHFF